MRELYGSDIPNLWRASGIFPAMQMSAPRPIVSPELRTLEQLRFAWRFRSEPTAAPSSDRRWIFVPDIRHRQTVFWGKGICQTRFSERERRHPDPEYLLDEQAREAGALQCRQGYAVSCPLFSFLHRSLTDRWTPPFFCAFNALAINHSCGWALLAPIERAA